jgi:hypothetical protein
MVALLLRLKLVQRTTTIIADQWTGAFSNLMRRGREGKQEKRGIGWRWLDLAVTVDSTGGARRGNKSGVARAEQNPSRSSKEKVCSPEFRQIDLILVKRFLFWASRCLGWRMKR